MDHLINTAQNLYFNSLAASTHKTYASGVGKLAYFRLSYGLPQSWPIPLEHLLLFIAYCSNNGLAASSVATYISGIGHFHKIHGLSDTTTSFLVVKSLEGLRRIQGGPAQDLRAPITLPLLESLIASLKHVCTNKYEQVLFSAAFSVAFFGLLRVGEFTTPSSNYSGQRLLLVNDVHISDNTMQLCIRWSKTDQYGLSTTISIRATGGLYCPVSNMQIYLKNRTHFSNNHLFVHFNAKSLTRYQFTSVLRKTLQFINAPMFIRSHSFRIGGATYFASQGVSDEQLKSMGRWKSSAYTRYIRLTA
jgi:hypothetical protein